MPEILDHEKVIKKFSREIENREKRCESGRKKIGGRGKKRNTRQGEIKRRIRVRKGETHRERKKKLNFTT